MKNEIYTFPNKSVLKLDHLTLWYNKTDGMYAQVYGTEEPDKMGLMAAWTQVELVKKNVTHEQFKKDYCSGNN